MSYDEAIRAYSKKFGGFPYYETASLSDEEVIEEVEKSLKTGKEIDLGYEDGEVI